MEFRKDGKKIEITAIFSKGRVGQTIILDHVSYGDNPDLTIYPLAQYPQPYTFTIVEKTEGKDGYYVVADGKGKRITLHNKNYGACEDYLYDANEWIVWQRMYEQERSDYKKHKIEQLESNLALLKEILTKQGIRIVSKDAAEELGLA